MDNKRILITGSQGQLGKEFIKVLELKGYNFVAPQEKNCDIANFLEIGKILTELNPQIIINCAAYNAVDEAEVAPKRADLVNNKAVANLARVCKDKGIFLVHYSSDYVFDGKKNSLYTEEDSPNPLNAYGKSKLAGEESIKKVLGNFLIFRLSWVIGRGRQNFLYKLKSWAAKEKVLKVSSDEISVPTYTADVVDITLLSLEKRLKGIFHLTNSGYCSRYELAAYFIRKMKLDNSILPASMKDFKTKAIRPQFSAMSNEKISKALGVAIPKWEKAIDRFIDILEED
ncbi:MAG: dTDP-4-dehydrorhamnose reductase [Omnitrophica bacterium]|nr:dTDP-4-dehydrorhamnose reductase [Candidatus Omnitrophota bacterium]